MRRTAAASQTNSATANDSPPWNTPPTSGPAETAAVLSTTNFLNTINVPLRRAPPATPRWSRTIRNSSRSTLPSTRSRQLAADRAELHRHRPASLPGLNDRFQTGAAADPDIFPPPASTISTLEAATPAIEVTRDRRHPVCSFTYATKTLTNANMNMPLPGLSSCDSFNIAVKKDGTTTNVAIDLSQVQGTLTLSNIVTYVNSSSPQPDSPTRFQKTDPGRLATPAKATFGLQITPGANETCRLSATSSRVALSCGRYRPRAHGDQAPSAGTAVNFPITQRAHRVFNRSLHRHRPEPQRPRRRRRLPTTTATYRLNRHDVNAQATQVDSSGNVYVIGSTTAISAARSTRARRTPI